MNSLEADGGNDDSRPFEDHNTKKVRFKDGFDVVAVDMVVDTDPSPSMDMLWKDKLLGVGLAGSVKEFIESDEGSGGDHILFEGDVIRSIVNGISTIDFLDRVKQILYKEMETMCGDGVDQVTRLLGFMYKRKIIGVISGILGKAAKFDFKNDNRIKGRFAKMAVFINLDRPLVS
ncbi:hypothetical protein Gorai_014840 [Gossypium raimondii]|uniref:Uncharacterized protein n=1 Tax=Gossypium raimondii TaxID=29730 RepID=A0A7J8P4A3_GOSRA|nr:hypothetical protein [Gossypium raimondii]